MKRNLKCPRIHLIYVINHKFWDIAKWPNKQVQKINWKKRNILKNDFVKIMIFFILSIFFSFCLQKYASLKFITEKYSDLWNICLYIYPAPHIQIMSTNSHLLLCKTNNLERSFLRHVCIQVIFKYTMYIY